MCDHLYDVVIIGGGVAGCKAAHTLYMKGAENILLLEAQNRLGGRIHTIFLDDNAKRPVEMGANWLHGTVVRLVFT
jgi:monoamine oxidase